MNLLPSPSYIRIHDFLVDFFGCLVPGFIFITLISLTLGWPIFSLYISLLSEKLQNKEICSGELLSNFKLEAFIFVIVLSYVVGHILFRQDPKLPDERSVCRQRKAIYIKDNPDGAVRLSKDEQKKDIGLLKDLVGTFLGLGFKKEQKPQDGAARSTEDTKKKGIGLLKNLLETFREQGPDVQFPYLYLHEYMAQRGLKHLASIIKWKGSKPLTYRYRTKAFINILKTRLEFVFPEQCGTLIKNEAHVRLMSSLWYMLFALQWASMLGSVIAIIAAARIVHRHSETCWYERHFLPLLISGLMIFVAFAARYIIEKFIHYQRCREIIYVLETAYFASKFGIVSANGKRVAVPEILENLY